MRQTVPPDLHFPLSRQVLSNKRVVLLWQLVLHVVRAYTDYITYPPPHHCFAFSQTFMSRRFPLCTAAAPAAELQRRVTGVTFHL